MSEIDSDNRELDCKDLECTLCGRSFSRKSKLSRHVREMHLNIKSFSCELCGKLFKRKSHLKRHMVSHSSEPKPFHCTQCTMQFSCKHHLLRHAATLHQALLPFECHVCFVRFSKRAALHKHLSLAHRLQKPHNCCLCARGFFKNGQLIRHLARVHPSSAKAAQQIQEAKELQAYQKQNSNGNRGEEENDEEEGIQEERDGQMQQLNEGGINDINRRNNNVRLIAFEPGQSNIKEQQLQQQQQQQQQQQFQSQRYPLNTDAILVAQNNQGFTRQIVGNSYGDTQVNQDGGMSVQEQDGMQHNQLRTRDGGNERTDWSLLYRLSTQGSSSIPPQFQQAKQLQQQAIQPYMQSQLQQQQQSQQQQQQKQISHSSACSVASYCSSTRPAWEQSTNKPEVHPVQQQYLHEDYWRQKYGKYYYNDEDDDDEDDYEEEDDDEEDIEGQEDYLEDGRIKEEQVFFQQNNDQGVSCGAQQSQNRMFIEQGYLTNQEQKQYQNNNAHSNSNSNVQNNTSGSSNNLGNQVIMKQNFEINPMQIEMAQCFEKMKLEHDSDFRSRESRLRGYQNGLEKEDLQRNVNSRMLDMQQEEGFQKAENNNEAGVGGGTGSQGRQQVTQEEEGQEEQEHEGKLRSYSNFLESQQQQQQQHSDEPAQFEQSEWSHNLNGSQQLQIFQPSLEDSQVHLRQLQFRDSQMQLNSSQHNQNHLQYLFSQGQLHQEQQSPQLHQSEQLLGESHELIQSSHQLGSNSLDLHLSWPIFTENGIQQLQTHNPFGSGILSMKPLKHDESGEDKRTVNDQQSGERRLPAHEEVNFELFNLLEGQSQYAHDHDRWQDHSQEHAIEISEDITDSQKFKNEKNKRE